MFPVMLMLAVMSGIVNPIIIFPIIFYLPALLVVYFSSFLFGNNSDAILRTFSDHPMLIFWFNILLIWVVVYLVYPIIKKGLEKYRQGKA